MARRGEPDLDRELAVLPPDLRWREWMRRIEAVLFASATPVARDDLARIVGQGASVDLLIEDLVIDLEGRPYEVARVGSGWMLRTRAAYASAICAAADVGDQALNMSEFDLAVLAAIAFHQPISRDGLKDIFGKEISRDLIGRLAECRVDVKRGHPQFVWWSGSMRALSNFVPARPYIARFRVFSRLI
jgi:segregation and condensation protein B